VNPSYSEKYRYDELYRLASAATGVGSLSWADDRYGNRLSQSESGGVPTVSLTISSTTNRVSGWTYDAAGNVTSDGVHTYAYDAEGVTLSRSPNSGVVEACAFSRRPGPEDRNVYRGCDATAAGSGP
jgi:hypothetical protein